MEQYSNQTQQPIITKTRPVYQPVSKQVSTVKIEMIQKDEITDEVIKLIHTFLSTLHNVTHNLKL